MSVRPARTSLVIILLATVTGSNSFAKKPDVWLEVRSPNFLVLTNASEKEGRRVAYQFEMIRAVFREVFNTRPSAKDPLVTILAAKDEDTLKTLLPEFWAKKGLMHPAGIYLGGPEKNYVALRLDVSMNQQAYEPYEPIYHEYVHFLTRRQLSQLPLWMVEGLAEFYGNIRLESHQAFVGAPSASNILVLRQNPPLPIRTLLAVDASSPYYHEENKTSIFYAESWALTHLLMTRDWRQQTHHIQDFVNLLGQNVAPEEAARKTIGDPETLEKELSAYIGLFSFTAARVAAPPALDQKTFQAEPVSEAESLAVRGDFLAHDRHYPEARAMLEEALKLDPKMAATHESLGFLAMQDGKIEEAMKWYAQAVALNSQSYLANYYYAVGLSRGAPDEATAAKAEASLRAAIKLAPDFAPAYASLAWLMGSRHEDLAEAHRMALIAVGLEPGNVHYRLTTAQVLESMGRVEDAIKVINIATSMAKTADERAEALAVLSSAQQYQDYEKRMKEQEQALRQQAEATAREASQSSLTEEASASAEKPSASAQGSTGPPRLRHRDEGPAAPTRALPADGAFNVHPLRPELLPGHKVAEGTIKGATCSGTATLELVLESATGTVQLYNDNYLKVPYSALNFTPQGILDPCTGLKGWHARITYRPARGEPRQGEIEAVQLVKK